MEKRGWELKDIIMMGVIGVIFAALYLASTSLWVAMQTAMTPFGLAVFAVDIVYGIWFMAGSIAAFILRKPGTAFLAEFMAAVIEMFMGNFGGPLVVLFGAVQGAGNEAGFAALRYRNFKLPGMMLSAVFAAVFSFVAEIITGSVVLLSLGLTVARLAVRVVSACIFTGLIAWLAAKGLARTGVLKSYPAGADVKAPKILDD
ncbi:MAG: ECF transporter S component [Clostridiales Family XIII bacterium]|nr:ECF transporter S component [Clostridiales Family XIII bacterium]